MQLTKRLSFLLFLLLFIPSLTSAEKKKPPLPPPDLDGRTYTITFPTDKKKPKEKVVFADGKITVQSLKDIEFKYKAKVKANYKGVVSETEYEAEFTTAEGITYEIDGAVMVNGEIRGSIIRREKDMDPTAVNFNGKQTAGKK